MELDFGAYTCTCLEEHKRLLGSTRFVSYLNIDNRDLNYLTFPQSSQTNVPEMYHHQLLLNLSNFVVTLLLTLTLRGLLGIF